jgi:hypothetical protein
MQDFFPLIEENQITKDTILKIIKSRCNAFVPEIEHTANGTHFL